MKTIVKKGLVALIASMFAVSVFAATQTGTTTSTKTLAHNDKAKAEHHACKKHCKKMMKKMHHHHDKKKVETDTTSTQS